MIVLNPDIRFDDTGVIQDQADEISRHTFNWRIRGIRILTEVRETGNFTWNVYSKKKSVPLTEEFENTLCEFISRQSCGQKQKNCKESICRRFLKSLEGNGIVSPGDIRPDHVRRFIVEISDARSKSMDDVIYTCRNSGELVPIP